MSSLLSCFSIMFQYFYETFLLTSSYLSPPTSSVVPELYRFSSSSLQGGLTLFLNSVQLLLILFNHASLSFQTPPILSYNSIIVAMCVCIVLAFRAALLYVSTDCKVRHNSYAHINHYKNIFLQIQMTWNRKSITASFFFFFYIPPHITKKLLSCANVGIPPPNVQRRYLSAHMMDNYGVKVYDK